MQSYESIYKAFYRLGYIVRAKVKQFISSYYEQAIHFLFTQVLGSLPLRTVLISLQSRLTIDNCKKGELPGNNTSRRTSLFQRTFFFSSFLCTLSPSADDYFFLVLLLSTMSTTIELGRILGVWRMWLNIRCSSWHLRRSRPRSLITDETFSKAKEPPRPPLFYFVLCKSHSPPMVLFLP